MQFTAYSVKSPKGSKSTQKKSTPAASRYFVSIYRPKPDEHSVAAVARETAGGVTAYRIYQEK
jgi:hypothetical protein